MEEIQKYKKDDQDSRPDQKVEHAGGSYRQEMHESRARLWEGRNWWSDSWQEERNLEVVIIMKPKEEKGGTNLNSKREGGTGVLCLRINCQAIPLFL